jgi:hypothetical protein
MHVSIKRKRSVACYLHLEKTKNVKLVRRLRHQCHPSTRLPPRDETFVELPGLLQLFRLSEVAFVGMFVGAVSEQRAARCIVATGALLERGLPRDVESLHPRA